MKHTQWYDSPEWRHKRKDVLVKHKYECQECKKRGKHTRATHVHHVKHLDKYPEYALDEYVTEGGTTIKNLVPLCSECHMKEHGYQHKPKEPLTKERW